jgi:SPP1 family predicted phage head-tail adaptor
MRHRITLQRKGTITRNQSGEEIITWSDWATVWASAQPMQGREFFESERAGAEITMRFRIRYRDGVTPTMRVSWDSRIFDIESVVNFNERDREIHLMCKELVND